MSGPIVGRGRPNWRRIALVVVAAVAVVGIGFGVQALSAPVERAGEPTLPVPSPSGTRFIQPTASPAITASGTASPAKSSISPPANTMRASGEFDWSTQTAAAASSTGQLYSFSVAVETTARMDADSAAASVAKVLNDPRSWTGSGRVRFALVGRSKATTTFYLASAKTAATLCGTSAAVTYTCAKGGTVVVNAERWKTGSATYPKDAAGYRTYLANHAIGQLLGKRPASCAGPGRKAPVMMQQGADLGGCTANPWP